MRHPAFLVGCGLLGLAAQQLASAPGARAEGAVPAVRVTVVRASESTPQRVLLIVRVIGSGMVLGSYQGKLRFDPAAFVADSTVAGSDGSRFVNAGDAKTGTIRFAGFTTKGFASAEAVRIFGRELRPLDAAHVTATIEVAGDLDGRPVARSGIFGATGVTIAR